MADAFGALASEHLDVAIAGLFRGSVNVLVEAEIFVSLKRLRVFGCEGVDVGFFDQYIIAVDRRFKFMKCFSVVVFADAGVDPIIPVVNSTERLLPWTCPSLINAARCRQRPYSTETLSS